MPNSPAFSTDYEYIGDEYTWNTLNLTELVKSLEFESSGELSDIFPDVDIPERTVTIEQEITSIGLMPLVEPGRPAPGSTSSSRYERRMVSPAYFRDHDFLDQFFINQVRKAGTFNEQLTPAELIANRISAMMKRHELTKVYYRTSALLGRIHYTDPITKVTIDVSTNIPAHNMFSYDNYSTAVPAGGTLAGGYVAAKNLTAKAGRNEALFFTNFTGQAGVPWTDRQSDFPRTIRYLRQYLRRTNKNNFTRIYMGSDLMRILEESEVARQARGGMGVFTTPASTVTGADGGLTSVVSTMATGLAVDTNGNITNIGGAEVRVLDTIYPDPNNNGELSIMWPQNKIALVAPTHYIDKKVVLGRTQHCVGEHPDGISGLWMRSNPDSGAPNVPGRSIQIGDAFLPYAIYPHWIAIITVAEASDITSFGLSGDIDFGMFSAQ